MSKVQLDAMVEEATVDCYNESEQITGLLTVIEDKLKVPFPSGHRCWVWTSQSSAWT
jgi:hypothetical protein